MSADLLRQAAARLRETAEPIPEGRWIAGETCVWIESKDVEDDNVVNDGWQGDGGTGYPEYIALMDPTVALAVADWLEALARTVERSGVGDHPEPMSITERGLAVARAVLRIEDEEQPPHVLNPEAVGDPDQTPVVQVSRGLAALLASTRCSSCGLVNHLHEDDCPEVRAS